MAAISGSVPVTGFIAPTDSTDTYPAIDPVWGIDGLRSVADSPTRNAIPAGRRREGMLVYTQDSQTYWTLLPSPWDFTDDDWIEFTGGGGSTANLLVGLDTSALTSSGLFGYVSTNGVLSLCDNLTFNSSLAVGVSNGISGQAICSGSVPNAKFTTVGGSPSPGQRVFLAASTDEANAAGKLTATPPTTGTLAIVGICVNNSNYAGAKTCQVVLQVREPIAL